MATFTGESVVNVVEISEVGGAFLYTVPSGRYAIVNTTRLLTVGFDVSLNVAGTNFTLVHPFISRIIDPKIPPFTLNEGDVFSSSTGSVSCHFVIFEYNRP